MGKAMSKRKKKEMWELWIKEPPMQLLSFDKGKTWEGKKFPFFPFAPININIDDVSYYFRKVEIV